MPKRPKKKGGRPKAKTGLSWVVPGLFGGMLLGFIAELIFGTSMAWMVGGAGIGLTFGAVADFIRNRVHFHHDEL